MKIIHNISQCVTMAGGARRGKRLAEPAILENAAIVISDEKILAVGNSDELLSRFSLAERIDAAGMAVVPGFVDPHTHLIWAGDRANEFEMRLQGKTYMEIMAAGGGILATLSATRKASLEELVAQSLERALRAFNYGTTTMEAKTGYGLDLETEFKQLEAILLLNRIGPFELVPTYMGAHAIPPEFEGNTSGYTRWLCEVALPETKAWWLAHAPGQELPFVDVFCEKGVFELAETHQILAEAAHMGFPLKLHADEFENLGGASLAAELGAVSADHLVKTSLEDIQSLAQSETVAVSLPGTPFGLAQREYTPARVIIDAGGYLALATDLNPGTTWNESMQFIQALSCRYLKLTPAEALAASTINSAKAISRDALVGSIEPGKQADLLILTVDDYRNLSYRYGTNLVDTVIKKGELYRSNSL
ncbi:MAG: imidazolonepropionase [Anaerolineaceae bacterium]